MKVLHVIPSLSLKEGGPSFALRWMEKALQDRGVEVTVATTDHDGVRTRLAVSCGTPVRTGSATRYYFRRQTEFYKYSRSLSKWLAENASRFDVIHVHALFSHASVTGARAAKRANIPYVVRPLGVLNWYGMTARRALLKRISFRFIEGPLLRHAAAVHFTSPQEKKEASRLGVWERAVVLPLGIDLSQFSNLPEPGVFLERWPQASGRRLVLFLSRLDPKKGLEALLDSWVEVVRGEPAAMLLIAGTGRESYVHDLHARAAALGIARDVLWLGHLDESSKLAALGASTAFVLPSLSENFGIAAVEALAAGLPSVLSAGVGISEEVAEARAGVVVSPSSSEIASALLRVLGGDGFAKELSSNARRLARGSYSLEAMGEGLYGLYAEILGRRDSAEHSSV